jgi:hypothetical protein
MTKTQLKLIPFGIAFILLLVQNAMLVKYKRGADGRIATLEQQILELKGRAGLPDPPGSN